MKLTLKIKLLPDENQAKSLLETIKRANESCNYISSIAWDNKVFNQFKVHGLCYYDVKEKFVLNAQLVVRCISKVADAYKLDKKTQRVFRPLGAITYDRNIISYKKNGFISIWSLDGRLKLPFVCHNSNYLPYIKGEADLLFKNNKFYVFQTVDVPDEGIQNVEEFIGCDFGITDIVVTSDGTKHSAQNLNSYREKRQKIRSSIQRKGTSNSRKLLKRLTGKESTTATIINHTISKCIVTLAKLQGKGIAIEDLTNIRFTSKRRGKPFRTKLGRWSFAQLRHFLEYKALHAGVKLVIVNPRYTSQTCSQCHHIGKRSGKSFNCTNCGNGMDADVNASLNIATLGGIVNCHEKSNTYSCSVEYSDLK